MLPSLDMGCGIECADDMLIGAYRRITAYPSQSQKPAQDTGIHGPFVGRCGSASVPCAMLKRACAYAILHFSSMRHSKHSCMETTGRGWLPATRRE